MKLRFEVNHSLVTVEVDFAALPDGERYMIEEKADINWGEWCYLFTGLSSQEAIVGFAKQNGDTIDLLEGLRFKTVPMDRDESNELEVVPTPGKAVPTRRKRIVAKQPTYASLIEALEADDRAIVQEMCDEDELTAS